MDAPVQLDNSPLLNIPSDIRRLICGWLDGRSFMVLSVCCKKLDQYAKGRETASIWQSIFNRENPYAKKEGIADWRSAVIKRNAFKERIQANIRAENYVSHKGELHKLHWRDYHSQVFCNGQIFLSFRNLVLTYDGKGNRLGEVRYASPFPPNLALRSINPNFFAITGPNYLNFFGGQIREPITWGGALAFYKNQAAYNTADGNNFILDLPSGALKTLDRLADTYCFLGLHQSILCGRIKSGELFIYNCDTQEKEIIPIPYAAIIYTFQYPLLKISCNTDRLKPILVYSHDTKKLQTLSALSENSFLKDDAVYVLGEDCVRKWDSKTGKMSLFASGTGRLIECLSKDKLLIGAAYDYALVWNTDTQHLIRKMKWSSNQILYKYPVFFGDLLVTLNVSNQWSVHFWDPLTGTKLGKVAASHFGGAERILAMDESRILFKVKESTVEDLYEYRIMDFDQPPATPMLERISNAGQSVKKIFFKDVKKGK